jgi:hypothetical protein
VATYKESEAGEYMCPPRSNIDGWMPCIVDKRKCAWWEKVVIIAVGPDLGRADGYRQGPLRGGEGVRRKPYTVIGIRRIPCCRCGKPSHASWQICADGNQYRGVCEKCDIALNELVLRFMKIPNAKKLMEKYIKEQKTQ